MDAIRQDFHDYIMRIEIPDDLEKKVESKIVSDLFGYCKGITPCYQDQDAF